MQRDRPGSERRVGRRGPPARLPCALGWEDSPARHDEERTISTGSTAAVAPVRVEVRGLSKSFGPVRAVSDLSFTVEPGSVTGFLGPNGAGKTTTLRMVLGLIRPDTGTAKIGRAHV